ncbi:MAG TPA: 1,4-alpha-glucan branching enzyme, partial [Microbacterium ginsengisoli]|nr:1,4-alpha-glucan branching enzyme [Microbacterium ginsengisoli]
MSIIDDAALDAVAHGAHHEPHAILGIHPYRDAAGSARATVRARRPLADSVTAVFVDGDRVPLVHVRSGIWEGERVGPALAYELETAYANGPSFTADDPYRHAPTIGELDLHLIAEGRHEQLWRG